MSNPENRQGGAKPRFPWLLLLLVVAGIYGFWILPAQLGPRKVQIEYRNAPPQP